ncbi:beta-xylosidase [Streptomyces sp. BE147]|uniref:beta-xylosidase n=1 Tax=Streptomyces sp. BE147 TaxID=3002524 RepID=UPI003FA7501C
MFVRAIRRRTPAPRRRWAAALGVTALVVAGTGALGSPALATATAAAAVDFPTHCIPPPIAGIPAIDGTTTARITVDNAAPKVGDTVTVTYTVAEPAASNPVDLALPADIMTPSGKVTVAGAQSAEVSVAGPKKNDPVPGKGAFPSFSMTGTFLVTAPGEITLSPGDYNIHTSYIMELDTPCTVTDPPAPVALTITATDGGGGTPDGSQRLTASVRAGTLSMVQDGDAVEMSAVDFGRGGVSRGSLRTVTVEDYRGGPAGWSLTGKVTDFRGPGGASVGAGALSWTPVCATKPGSPSTSAAGSAGTVGGAGATLASTPDGAFTGGEFTVDARLALNIPAYTATGAYSGVLTLTLT